MTSRELKEQAKEVKRIEDTIKQLKVIQKAYCKLERLNYDSRKAVCFDKFADTMYYNITDEINRLRALIGLENDTDLPQAL